MVPPMSAYKSIFLDTNWVFCKYYGWQSLSSDPCFLVFFKRFGPVKRYLILSDLHSDYLCDKLQAMNLFSWFSVVNIKDFSSVDVDISRKLILGAFRVHQVSEKYRVFNRYTSVIDLAQPQDSIWSRMKPDNRRLCRKNIASGMTVESTLSPSHFILSLFFERYQKLCIERSLSMPSHSSILQMMANKQLEIFFSINQDVIGSIALIYTAGNKAFYLYGVSGERPNDGSGQLLQWKIIENLRASGYQWYDLGGVSDASGAIGIYRFKLSIGGALFDLGPEYFYCALPLRLMGRVWSKLSSWL